MQFVAKLVFTMSTTTSDLVSNCCQPVCWKAIWIDVVERDDMVLKGAFFRLVPAAVFSGFIQCFQCRLTVGLMVVEKQKCEAVGIFGVAIGVWPTKRWKCHARETPLTGKSLKTTGRRGGGMRRRRHRPLTKLSRQSLLTCAQTERRNAIGLFWGLVRNETLLRQSLKC